jgi:hypothetical protein
MSPRDMREKLLRDVQNDGELTHPYLHYMESQAADKVPGGTDLADYVYDMPKDQHMPQVLVFERGMHGGYAQHTFGHDVILASGRYKVTRTRILPGKLDMGRDLPSNIHSIKYVYVEPVGPDPTQHRKQ